MSKIRGKSALHVQNDNSNRFGKSYISATQSLLKIEPFVPTLTTRARKPIHRSYSTLSSSYFKRVCDPKSRTSRHPEKSQPTRQRSKSSLSATLQPQNGYCRISRPAKDQEKMPDRINYDRRGLTAIPVFENEQNLRLLSLQHNLINIFHVPDDSKGNNLHQENEDNSKQVAVPSVDQDTPNMCERAERHHRNGIGNKRHHVVVSPTVTNAFPPSLNTPAAIHSNGTNTNQSKLAVNNSNNNINGYNNLNNNNMVKNSFIQKSVVLHTHSRYGSMRRSKSFISNYSKHFNSMKQNLQKCSITKPTNLISYYGAEGIIDTNGIICSGVSAGSGCGTVSSGADADSVSGIGSSTSSVCNMNGSILEKDNALQQEISLQNEKNIDDINELKIRNQQLVPIYGNIFQNLVFLDLYDNQIEKISNLDGLKCLTVLLLGKNRITDISGLSSLKNTLRVLDLHGNKITNLSNKINCLQELKSLNLAGNQIRQINQNDFAGLLNLKELNLKRNRIKRLHGFNHLNSLERLWLCHNDLQKVEDMSSIAKAINLQEVTIENNPVSLAGDCVSFLVSYLPNLNILSQMPITDQVRRAAMAWRKNKEMSDSAYSNLTSDIYNNIRREEVISNARTNWELLRSQQMLGQNKKGNANPVGDKNTTHELESINQMKMNQFKTKEKPINGKMSNSDFQELFRLPPILQPYANSSDKTPSSGSSLGPNIDSSSSCYSTDNEENDTNFFSEAIAIRVPQMNEQPLLDGEECFCEPIPQNIFKEVLVIEDSAIDTSSNLSTNPAADQLQKRSPTPESKNVEEKPKSDTNNNTTTANDNASQSDKNSNLSTPSLRSESEAYNQQPINPPDKTTIKGRATNGVPTRRYMHGTLTRSQTAKPRTSMFSHSQNNNNNNTSNNNNNNVNQKTNKPLVEREREQGGDYLIEICGRYLNIYGLGALRFIDKQWNAQKANDVHTLNFSYINFNSIITVLGRIKVRFPNAESFVFRETNINSLGQLNALAELQGITSLVVDPEGNNIYTKNWRPYAVYRLSHWGLKSINGREITEAEIEAAQMEYAGLSDLVLWSLPESLLQPLLARLRLDETCSASKLSAKDWLMKAEQSLKVVVGKEALQWRKIGSNCSEDIVTRDRGRLHFTVMIENMCNAVEKLQKLETLWPNVLLDIVRNTLLDYSQFDVYIRNLMLEIMNKNS